MTADHVFNICRSCLIQMEDLRIVQCVKKLGLISARRLHNGAACFAGSKWRLEQGLGQYGNEYGALTDIPDWSYADGRPSPITHGEKTRQEKRKDFAKKALNLMDEMRQSKTIHKEKQQAQIKAKERHLKQKLKPKMQNIKGEHQS